MCPRGLPLRYFDLGILCFSIKKQTKEMQKLLLHYYFSATVAHQFKSGC